MDVPVTLLLAPEEPAPWRALGGLARRLAAKLDHAVEACDRPGRDGGLEAAIDRGVARGASRFVVLPLVLSQADPADARVDLAIAAALERRPHLAIHRGAPLGTDDLARLLGDRAREARGGAGDGAVVLLARGGQANPAANAELARLARLVYEAHRFRDVGYAFLDLTAPSVGEAVARWARLGAPQVIVVPCLAFAGAGYRRLRALATAAGTASGVAVPVARPLASHPAFVWGLARRHLEALEAPSLGAPGGPGTAPYVNPALRQRLAGAHAHDAGPPGVLEARMAALLPPQYRAPGVPVSPAPMGAAALEIAPDGAVAWDRMWQGFCELALAGGPPHRGALLEPASREDVLGAPARYAEVVRELQRGIRLVTGLPVRGEGPPGWVGVECASEAMAIWLMRAIVVENVLARREGRVLYVPAGPAFTLEGEIRNVVTTVAKTHHYWTAHVAGRSAG